MSAARGWRAAAGFVTASSQHVPYRRPPPRPPAYPPPARAPPPGEGCWNEGLWAPRCSNWLAWRPSCMPENASCLWGVLAATCCRGAEAAEAAGRLAAPPWPAARFAAVACPAAADGRAAPADRAGGATVLRGTDTCWRPTAFAGR